VPLSDGAGEVEAVGEGVTRVKIGDRQSLRHPPTRSPIIELPSGCATVRQSRSARSQRMPLPLAAAATRASACRVNCGP
jgi:NADPH:quinone reductase-like Zn-dependent oxidoreductase